MPGIVLMQATAGDLDHAMSVLLAILWTSHGFVSILHSKATMPSSRWTAHVTSTVTLRLELGCHCDSSGVTMTT